MSLLYALQTLPERRLGHKQLPLEDLSTITVHVVTSSPVFDSEPWEIFMHRLPNLKQLNVVFVMQGKHFKESFKLNGGMSLRRCSDCEVKNQGITYSIKQIQYHMFFSSEEYTSPAVMVVYGNTDEMSARCKDKVHSEI